jgi:hypothetical protein
VALNRPSTPDTREKIVEIFTEVIMRRMRAEAILVGSRRRPAPAAAGGLPIRAARRLDPHGRGRFLAQSRDAAWSTTELEVVSRRRPPAELGPRFAFRVASM